MEAGIAVRDEQSSREAGERHEPICVSEANASRAGPDITLIAQDILYRLQSQAILFSGA